jgi:hypothetical protein
VRLTRGGAAGPDAGLRCAGSRARCALNAVAVIGADLWMCEVPSLRREVIQQRIKIATVARQIGVSRSSTASHYSVDFIFSR